MVLKVMDSKFNIEEADTFWKRLKGLIGVKKVPHDGGMLFRNCASIHCMFMSATIDVVYLNKDYEVLAYETVKPWHLGKIVKGAKHVIELHEGVADSRWIGNTVEFN